MKRLLFVISLIACFFLFSPNVHAATKTYTVPGPSAAKPRLPELYANEGQTFQEKGITVTILPNTVPYDSYVTFDVVEHIPSIKIGPYWKVSPNIWQVDIRSFHTGAKVLNPRKGSIIVLPYAKSDLAVSPYLSFPENTLKVVCSPDGGASWTMERSSFIDTRNQTVSAITKIGGGCMLMAGFVKPTQYNNFKSVKGAFVANAAEMNELVEEELKEAPLGIRLRAGMQKSLVVFYQSIVWFLNLLT